jgi:hypothetical protein
VGKGVMAGYYEQEYLAKEQIGISVLSKEGGKQ